MNLEMCNECLEYGTLNEYGRCSECENVTSNSSKKQLKDKMIEHLTVAKSRGFNDKTMRLTVSEIEMIIECLK